MDREIAIIGEKNISEVEREGYKLVSADWDCETRFESYFYLASDLESEKLRKFNERAIEAGIEWNLFYLGDNERLYIVSFQEGTGCLECLKNRLKSNGERFKGDKDEYTQVPGKVLEKSLAEMIEKEALQNRFLEIDTSTGERRTHHFFPLDRCEVCEGLKEEDQNLEELKNAVGDIPK